jgi:hypothetical protein
MTHLTNQTYMFFESIVRNRSVKIGKLFFMFENTLYSTLPKINSILIMEIVSLKKIAFPKIPNYKDSVLIIFLDKF